MADITLPRLIIAISLVGVYYLNHARDRKGFLWLMASAFLWAFHNWTIGEYEQMATTAFSGFTSMYGYWKWSKDEK